MNTNAISVFTWPASAPRVTAMQGVAMPGTALRLPTVRGQFCEAGHGLARLSWAGHGNTLPRAVSGTNFFASQCLDWMGVALLGRARLGNTSPGTVIPDNFGSVEKRPHHAEQ